MKNPQPHEPTIREFLRRLGHRVALIGMKPVNGAPKSMVIWPAEQDDVADQACWISRQYHATYCNLNPLVPEMLECVPRAGISIRNKMIAKRTRVLIDIDAHGIDKEIARQQKDEFKARYGTHLIETDSGNGFALVYGVDYPNNDESKTRIQTFLEQLKVDYPCLDTSVFGASRLTRIAGTLNRCKISGERIPTSLLN